MPSSARSAMRFRRLRLRNWRNFVDIDVELQRRAFLVGANASGKSNLLDVFRFLRDVASPGGGFEHAVWSRGGVSRIRSLAASRKPSVEIFVAVGDDEDEWEYLLRFGQDGKDNPVVEAEQVRHAGKLILNRPNAADKADGALLTQTHLQQIAANGKFRALAEFFSSVSYLHVVPQSIRETGVLPARANDQYGSDLIERIADTLHPGLIEYVPQMLARMQLRTGRQTLISTHSPELLRDEGIGLDEVLILEPGEKGTGIRLAADTPELRGMVAGGIPLGDVVLPETRPANASQLAFYAR